MLKTRLNNMLDIKHPVIQEAIPHIAGVELAEAVCRSGGLGVLCSFGLSGEELEKKIEKLKSAVDSPFGISADLDRENSGDILETAINCQAPVVITSGENPAKHAKTLKERGIRLIHEVSTVEQARESEKSGADALIVRGVESGGFFNVNGLGALIIIPAISEAVKIPIVAAGGVVDGRSMSAVLSMGAEGVQMGTRFAASMESGGCEEMKKACVKSNASDTVIITYRGRPFRVLMNAASLRIQKEPAEDKIIEELLMKGAIQGGDEEVLIQAGQGVGFIKSVKAVKDIIREILFEVMMVKDQISRIQVSANRFFE